MIGAGLGREHLKDSCFEVRQISGRCRVTSRAFDGGNVRIGDAE